MEIRIALPFDPDFHDPKSLAALEQRCTQHGREEFAEPPIASVHYPPNGRVAACPRALRGIIEDAIKKFS
jgi:hypothetical protein